jgi:four helix bundle protein
MTTLNRAKQLQHRTKQFAIRFIHASTRVSKTEAGRVLTRQFLRSGTSLAANYRAACRARSGADFISKISIVAEETDETLFWFELLVEAKMMSLRLVQPLMLECEELLKIFSRSGWKSRARAMAQVGLEYPVQRVVDSGGWHRYHCYSGR